MILESNFYTHRKLVDLCGWILQKHLAVDVGAHIAQSSTRKFFDLHASSKSSLAEQALQYIGQLCEIARQAKDLDPDDRRRIRQEKAKPLIDALHAWMQAQRARVPDGSATAKAFDYGLKRWIVLTRYLDDAQLPIDNNHIEQQIRPVAIGGSLCTSFGDLVKHWKLANFRRDTIDSHSEVTASTPAVTEGGQIRTGKDNYRLFRHRKIKG